MQEDDQAVRVRFPRKGPARDGRALRDAGSKERFADPADYEKVKGAYVIDAATMKSAKKDMIVMHPLPRVTEISMDFDDDPRVAYFRQMEYGLYVRMALLAMVLGKA